jgi:hypothetical protein
MIVVRCNGKNAIVKTKYEMQCEYESRRILEETIGCVFENRIGAGRAKNQFQLLCGIFTVRGGWQTLLANVEFIERRTEIIEFMLRALVDLHNGVADGDRTPGDVFLADDEQRRVLALAQRNGRRVQIQGYDERSSIV